MPDLTIQAGDTSTWQKMNTSALGIRTLNSGLEIQTAPSDAI
jgi:hypothetical protein